MYSHPVFPMSKMANTMAYTVLTNPFNSAISTDYNLLTADSLFIAIIVYVSYGHYFFLPNRTLAKSSHLAVV
jgi:hypothetical protein